MKKSHGKRFTPSDDEHAKHAMPEIESALDDRRMQPIIAALHGLESTTNTSIRLLSSTVVRHKPGRRCIIRYALETGDGGARRRQILLGKIRARGFDRRTYKLMRRMWQDGFGPQNGDSIHVPEPVGAIPELNMWLQKQVAAKTLDAQLEAPNAAENCRVAARALHKLHSTGPRPSRRHGVRDEIRILNFGLDNVKRELSYLAPRIERIQRGCRDIADGLDDNELATLHRDFYPNQILVDGQSAWLLDLDLCAQGDPAVDAGNFIAHLQEKSLRKYGHCHVYANLEQSFLDGYRSASGRSISFSVQSYVTLTLARLIAISRRISSRHHTTEALMQVCERRLDLGVDSHSLIFMNEADHKTSGRFAVCEA